MKYQNIILRYKIYCTDNIHLPEDNHFLNMLDHFSKLINTGNGLDDEYSQNINQARLIRELSDKSRMA